MKHCGAGFHAEVGKFRFLNEMIKLVSPKYLGGQTPLAVRQRVLLLLHTWTVDYPRETKIREAYDMLKKQGVVKVWCLKLFVPNISRISILMLLLACDWSEEMVM
jgi:ADP-ribosylation factor-binding protein GGA